MEQTATPAAPTPCADGSKKEPKESRKKKDADTDLSSNNKCQIVVTKTILCEILYIIFFLASPIQVTARACLESRDGHGIKETAMQTPGS